MVVGEMALMADLVIIGGGPGGYHAAIRAAQLGRQVLLIEQDALGGICLNKGCIPSKILAAAAEKLNEARKPSLFGLQYRELELDFAKMKEYQRKSIETLKSGIEALCKENKVQVITGTAFFLSTSRIGVESGDSYEIYEFQNAIIATGARPVIKEGMSGGPSYLNAWNISFPAEIPAHLAIHGSSPLSLEMAMAYKGLGSEVTLLLPGKTCGFDSVVEKELFRVFKKEKINVLKECRIQAIDEIDSIIHLTVENPSGERTLMASHVFFEGGSAPNTEGLGIDRLGIEADAEGFIKTDSQCKTSIAGIYAVGDITGAPFSAAKAIRQGKVAAEASCCENTILDLKFMPRVAFTTPPIAAAGMTEEEANDAGLSTRASVFPLAAIGYSALSGKRDGIVKIVSETGTDAIIGIHIIGSGAHELMFGGMLALEMGAREEDLVFPAYLHPGLCEAILEAAEGLKGKAVHVKPGKQGTREQQEHMMKELKIHL